jgi:hypothetical protein
MGGEGAISAPVGGRGVCPKQERRFAVKRKGKLEDAERYFLETDGKQLALGGTTSTPTSKKL